MTIRQTYTYAELDVSAATYDEIAGKLRTAGYDHAFLDYNRVEGRTHSTIDMHGIGLVRASQEEETVMRYVTTRVVDAIQWNGPHTLEDIQRFLAGGVVAASPYWNGSGNMADQIAVPIRDLNEDSRWPTLSPHFKMEHVAIGGWILRDEAGNLSTMTGARFAAECSPVPEAAAASLVSAMAAMNEPDVEEPPAAPALAPPLDTPLDPDDDEIPL